MNESIKFLYRALGGTLLIILIIICGIIALAFLVAGVALAGLSWLLFISPDILKTYRISFLGERVVDPFQAFLLFLLSGLTLAAFGIILFGCLYFASKAIQKIAKDLISERAQSKETS
ncbi:MAG: hypothetical protein ACFFB2_12290 [Promethearchaeota archaeon]